MTQIAIIPARGGSKRLPRKNIIDLAGKPLLARVINACVTSDVFDEIVVSTDDQEIALIAEAAGASVHLRPSELGNDKATVVDVCLDVLDSMECDVFCCVYATSALLKGETIRKSSDVFVSDHNSSVLMGVSEYNYHPFQAMTYDESGYVKLLYPEHEKLQSQSYPPVFVSNGTFYWANAREFKEEKTFYGRATKPFIVNDYEVCDLDTPKDYEKLKIKYLLNL